jgi:hypothetical protein
VCREGRQQHPTTVDLHQLAQPLWLCPLMWAMQMEDMLDRLQLLLRQNLIR